VPPASTGSCVSTILQLRPHSGPRELCLVCLQGSLYGRRVMTLLHCICYTFTRMVCFSIQIPHDA
jgi:hypothetical protein